MNLTETCILPSGAKLVLNDPGFQEAMAILEATAREIGTVKTGIKIEGNISDPAAMLGLLTQEMPIDLLKDLVCQAISSPQLKGALIACMGRCLYNGQSMTLQAFENRNARQDYLPAAWEVMKFNLLPFFAGVLSRSKTPGAPTGAIQK